MTDSGEDTSASSADNAPDTKTPDDKAARIEILRENASDCTACDLSLHRTHVVFGEGNPKSSLVIVGEGPGENEDKTGRPFVGRAGVLLDEVLRECNMLRRHVFITNVVRCRPTLDDGTSRLKNRPPTAPEVAACTRLWLEPTLGVVEPLVILCLGATPANAIIHRNFKMLKERGEFFPSKYARYAIAGLHPAYILRQQGEAYDEARATLVADIEAARKKVIEAKKEPPATLF